MGFVCLMPHVVLDMSIMLHVHVTSKLSFFQLDNFFGISSDFSDLPDMTVEYCERIYFRAAKFSRR